MVVLYAPSWCWILVTGVAALLSRKYIRSYFRSVLLVLRLPGPPAAPFIGHAHWAVDTKRLAEGAVTIPKDYGPIIRAWISLYPVIFVFEPRYIQKILSNSKHVEKLFLYKMLHNFLGDGLVTSDSHKWRTHRRMMQPIFRPGILEGFVDIFSRGAESLVDSIKSQVQNGSAEVSVGRFVNETVFSILLEVILGVPLGSPQSIKLHRESPYRNGTTTLLQRLLRPWLLVHAIYQITDLARKEMAQNNALVTFTEKVILERRRILDTTPTAQKCVLDHLLEVSDKNPESFSSEDCVHEACTLMLAGQDTVGGAIAFTLHLLATNANEQEIALREQQVIFGNSTRPANIEDVARMTYLECCIKEALRLYPSVPIIGRTLGEDVKLGKWTIPEGCDVLICPFATHRLEEFYSKPDVFDPERFSSKERPLGSYIPFSLGSRNCIGYKYAELEMKAILSTMLRHFRLQPVSGKEQLTLSYRVTLRAHGGIRIKVIPRTLDEKLGECGT